MSTVWSIWGKESCKENWADSAMWDAIWDKTPVFPHPWCKGTQKAEPAVFIDALLQLRGVIWETKRPVSLGIDSCEVPGLPALSWLLKSLCGLPLNSSTTLNKVLIFFPALACSSVKWEDQRGCLKCHAVEGLCDSQKLFVRDTFNWRNIWCQ